MAKWCGQCGRKNFNQEPSCIECGASDGFRDAPPEPAPPPSTGRPTPSAEQPKATKTCPLCAEEVKVEASVCKHCGKRMPEFTASGARKVPSGQAVAIVVVALVLIVGGLLYLQHRQEQRSNAAAKERVCEFIYGVKDC